MQKNKTETKFLYLYTGDIIDNKLMIKTIKNRYLYYWKYKLYDMYIMW